MQWEGATVKRTKGGLQFDTSFSNTGLLTPILSNNLQSVEQYEGTEECKAEERI